MIYVDNHSTDPYFNFALEYYLLTEKELDDKLIFLFWRTTPTLMVGKYQNTVEEINTAYVDAHHINVVRRLSGGGTIYTDPGGWQFSFIVKGRAGEISFSEFITPVVEALRDMGVDAGFNGRNDLVIGGKKFSGNAQYMHRGNTVHHGSLLFDTDLEELVKSTTVDAQKIVSKGIKSVRDRVTNISDHLEHPVSAEEFRDIMVKSLMKDADTVYKLTCEDTERINELAGEKFRSWQAIYGDSPPFNITRTGRFDGGKAEFRLDVQKGIITGAQLCGDFFCAGDTGAICGALIGCRYSAESIKSALSGKLTDDFFYKIRPDEIIGLIAP